MHVGQSNIASTIAKGESFVVQTQLTQDGRVDVIHSDGISKGVGTELVGFAVGDAPLNPPSAVKIV